MSCFMSDAERTFMFYKSRHLGTVIVKLSFVTRFNGSCVFRDGFVFPFSSVNDGKYYTTKPEYLLKVKIKEGKKNLVSY